MFSITESRTVYLYRTGVHKIMTRAALEQLRRQAAHTVELIDAILLAQPNVATQATRQLVPALRLLSSRVQLVLDAAQREGTP